MKVFNYGAVESVASGFYNVVPEDEYFRPEIVGPTYEAVETQYFGFNIPEHNINGEFYIWHHPALKITSGGFTCWKGHRPRHLSADYHEYRYFMPMPERTDEFTLPNGVSVKFIEPLKVVELKFSDEVRDTSVEVLMTAVMPPAGRGNGGHFTQAMRTKGKLRLRGVDYEIDGFYTRDHSWGESRSEAHLNLPPLSWIAGVFNENFAFHVCAFDDAESHPEWEGIYDGPPPGENLRWGYIWKDGELKNVVKCRKFSKMSHGNTMPGEMDLQLTDSDGQLYHIKGTATAVYPWICWSNMQCSYALTKWECEGHVGWGDTQDCLWNEYTRRVSA